jgi:hypothetical protein
MTEREAVRLLEWDGTPLSCHLMLTAGPRASLGLLSPGDRPIERGDRFTVAFGEKKVTTGMTFQRTDWGYWDPGYSRVHVGVGVGWSQSN